MDHRWDGAGYGGRGGGGIRVVVVVVVAGGRGGEGDGRRGCLRQTASHRRVVHSKDGTRIGRLESRWSLVAGRQNGRAKLRSQAAKRQAGQKNQERPRWLQGAAESPYQAGGQSRAREKGAGGQKGRCVRNEHCPCGFGTILPLVHCPLSSGWPAQPSAWPRAACDALGDGGTAASKSSSNRGSILSCRGITATTAAQCDKPLNVYYGEYIASLEHLWRAQRSSVSLCWRATVDQVLRSTTTREAGELPELPASEKHPAGLCPISIATSHC